jgi:t-SNARE complex subunit (syntaxin)
MTKTVRVEPALLHMSPLDFTTNALAEISKQLKTEVSKASTAASKGKLQQRQPQASAIWCSQRCLIAGKNFLDALKAEGEALTKTNPKSERLQPYKAQYMRLCKSYVDVMKQHQQAKETMRKTQTENLVRRGKIVLDDGRSDEELRAEAERNPSGFLSQAIMEEASVEAQQAYIDAQSRARDVEMLVRSINEVASMFQDLAVLIQHQSEMLDNIGRGNHSHSGGSALPNIC